MLGLEELALGVMEVGESWTNFSRALLASIR